MTLDLATLLKLGTTLVAVTGLAKGGYETWREYDLWKLNQAITRCEVAELREHVISGKPIENQCWRLALERTQIPP